MAVFRIAVIFVACGVLFAGCDGPRGRLSADQVQTLATAPAQPAAYRLAPGDKVKVTVFNEPDFTGEFQVNMAGNVAFPLIGDVAALNVTTSVFKERLAARLRRGYVRKPEISIEVTSYRPVNVIGEVKGAGQFQFRPGLTVQDAIALAGGYSYRANTRRVYIRRADAGGEIVANTDDEPVVIEPGDSIRIPERFF
jgi:protein involved in polysaccharide export with SLBB domain